MEEDIKSAKPAIHLARLIGFHVLREKDPLCSQLSFFPEVLPPPEEGVEPEDPEDRNKKCGHNDENRIKHWLSLWIIMGRMGKPHYEVSIGSWVTFSTGLYQSSIRDEGFWIIHWQDAVKSVAVRTTRD